MKMQASITVSPVHGVGYRIFLLQKALGYRIQRFDARNEVSHKKQQVIVRAEGEPAMIEEFCSFIHSESHPMRSFQIFPFRNGADMSSA